MPEMSEADLDRAVRRLIALYGLKGYHTHDSRGSQPGFPDWVIWGSGVIFRELKRPFTNPTGAQRITGYELQAAGQNWDIWRPIDLESGRIAQELQAISPTWIVPPESSQL